MLFLVLCFNGGLAHAQLRLHGTVKDRDGSPVMAVVYTPNYKATTQCDADGKFELVVAASESLDTIMFRQLGYKDELLVVDHMNAGPITVTMERQVVQLDGVPISAREADNLIHKAFARIHSNYPQQKTIYPAFYRQVHKENGRYVRLIEAGLDISEPKYVTQRVFDNNTKVHINHVRRSGVYEDNGDDHGDHLVDLLEDNPLLYFWETFLSPNAGKDVVFWIDTATLHRTDSVVVIGYATHTPTDRKTERGTIYIYRPDMAITRVESQRARNKNYPNQPTSSNHSWDLVDGGRVVQFKKIGHTYYPDSMAMWYTHDVREHNFPNKKWHVEEAFNIWLGNPNISDTAAYIPFSVFGNLYTKHDTYNYGFWSSYGMLQKHPCPDDVVKGLSRNEPLDMQFADGN